MIPAIGVIASLLALWMLSGYLPTRKIQTPSYTVVTTVRDYQIRQYQSYVVAETHQKGSREEAASGGFRELFRYISGSNSARSKVPMTAPVLQSSEGKGAKIAMSAPVIKEGDSTIAFVMPRGYRPEDLPQPTSANVKLRAVPAHRVAVTTFSGLPTDAKIRRKTEQLLSALERDGVAVSSSPRIALYNPPWTPPFMRKNEVMVVVH